MTQHKEEDTQKPEGVPAEEQPQDAGEQGDTVSDEQVEDDGTGTHGRPSDDSDPGHS